MRWAGGSSFGDRCLCELTDEMMRDALSSSGMPSLKTSYPRTPKKRHARKEESRTMSCLSFAGDGLYMRGRFLQADVAEEGFTRCSFPTTWEKTYCSGVKIEFESSRSSLAGLSTVESEV